MRQADVLTLFDYLYWANHRLLDAAARLTTHEFVAPSSVTTRDLRATLVHELDVEWSWRLNLQDRLTDDLDDLDPIDYPSVDSLRERWARDEAEMRAWIGELSDADLAADVTSGLTRDRRPLWQYLVHIVFHAAQQQADAATLLTLSGQSPGDLGFGEYLRSR